ncbi:MAG: cation:proton antiporter, partial [Acidimicrobiia bacterium]|nr:cation:proton antiporter [Acidimicrobiia bacterium]
MDHGVLLLLELGAVVLGLGILARLAGRVSISPIPFYLLAGLAFGEGGIAPIVTSEEFIEIGAELGVIFLLLLLGLEYSARELIASMRAVAPAGTLDLVLNFAPGFVTGLLLGWGVSISLFLGGVTYISSSGVVAKLVNDLGWTANTETPVILSVLVFEDLVMAVMLPILAAVALGSGASQAALSIAIALAVIGAA